MFPLNNQKGKIVPAVFNKIQFIELIHVILL